MLEHYEEYPVEMTAYVLFAEVAGNRVLHKLQFASNPRTALECGKAEMIADTGHKDIEPKIVTEFRMSDVSKGIEERVHNSLMAAIKRTDEMYTIEQLKVKNNKRVSYATFANTLSFVTERHPRWLTASERGIINKLIAKCRKKSFYGYDKYGRDRRTDGLRG